MTPTNTLDQLVTVRDKVFAEYNKNPTSMELLAYYLEVVKALDLLSDSKHTSGGDFRLLEIANAIKVGLSELGDVIERVSKHPMRDRDDRYNLVLLRELVYGLAVTNGNSAAVRSRLTDAESTIYGMPLPTFEKEQDF